MPDLALPRPCSAGKPRAATPPSREELGVPPLPLSGDSCQAKAQSVPRCKSAPRFCTTTARVSASPAVPAAVPGVGMSHAGGFVSRAGDDGAGRISRASRATTPTPAVQAAKKELSAPRASVQRSQVPHVAAVAAAARAAVAACAASGSKPLAARVPRGASTGRSAIVVPRVVAAAARAAAGPFAAAPKVSFRSGFSASSPSPSWSLRSVSPGRVAGRPLGVTTVLTSPRLSNVAGYQQCASLGSPRRWTGLPWSADSVSPGKQAIPQMEPAVHIEDLEINGGGLHEEPPPCHWAWAAEPASVATPTSDRRCFSIADDTPPCYHPEHFSIADRPPLDPKAREERYQEVARSLEIAACAIRQVISHGGAFTKDGLPQANASSLSSAPQLASSPAATSLGGQEVSSDCQDKQVSVARLSRENEVLRGALGDAMRRLKELEGEQERFLSEGVFDLVNSLCRSGAGDTTGRASRSCSVGADVAAGSPLCRPCPSQASACR